MISARCFAVICSVIIVTLLGSSLVTMCQAKTLITLGSRWEIPSEEIQADSDTCIVLGQYFSRRAYQIHNCYGSSTTRQNILNAAYGWGDSYAITWYIGHGTKEEWWHFWGWPWQWHTHKQYAICTDDGSWVYDYDIYESTGCRNVRFVFLYSCNQGDEIGRFISYPCGQQRARGMPFAWLHTSDLSSNGYENPDNNGYVFTGFKGVGPFLTYDGFGVQDACKYFVWAIYRSMIYYLFSLRGALDFAANHVWGVSSFEECILYQGYSMGGYSGQLVVYGDGNFVLQ